MKKITALLLVLSMFLVGCGGVEDRSVEHEERKQIREELREQEKDRFSNSNYYIILDRVTGCKYLEYYNTYGGGVTPLLKSDGTPDCEGI